MVLRRRLCFASLLLHLLGTTALSNGKLDGDGPVVHHTFPDPCITSLNGVWYAFSTQTNVTNVPMATSTDFSNWKFDEGHDALPTVGDWVRQPPNAGVWAPDVAHRPDGKFVMYYAAAHESHRQKHCIGAAIADSIQGPYEPLNTTLVCNVDGGGNIDPNHFIDPATGAVYLAYKTDGNTIGHGGSCGNSKGRLAPTPLYLQLLDPVDFVTPIGAPIFLFSNSRVDGPNVERPCMFHFRGTYYLAYNNHCFQDTDYEIHYVMCKGASDVTQCDWPSLKDAQSRRRRPLLRTGDTPAKLVAPGSLDVSADGTRAVFHSDVDPAWFRINQTTRHHEGRRDRAMFAVQLDYDSDGSLKVGGLY